MKIVCDSREQNTQGWYKAQPGDVIKFEDDQWVIVKQTDDIIDIPTNKKENHEHNSQS